MLENLWNLEQFAWDQPIETEPAKIYCCPV